jgi:hypothetical protein
LTKDDVDDGASSGDEGPQERKTFRKADPAVLAAREKLAPRRRYGAAPNPTKEAVDAILATNTNPAPPAELVPKPTVGNWKPAALNFAGAKKTDASPVKATVGEEGEKATTTTVAAKPAAAVPHAFSTKFMSFSSKFGAPPASQKPVEGEGAKEGETTQNGASNASTASSSAAKPAMSASSASKPAEVAPLVGTGFKFTANTKWSFGKSSATAENSGATTDAKSGDEAAKIPPATQKTWNFMSKVKPAPLSSHFPAAGTSAGTEGVAKPAFQFGKNVAPAKASEVSKEVLKDLATPKDDSAAKLSDATPVVTHTGEEEETPLFTADAKLFELDAATKTWPERGVGVFRVNQFKTDPSRLRLVMHVKTTLKLILNTPIYAAMTAVPTDKQPTCIKFTGIPIPIPPSSEQKAAAEAAEEQQQEKTEKKTTPAVSVFNLKFRDAETAAKALKAIKDALEKVKAAPSSSASSADQKTEEKSEKSETVQASSSDATAAPATETAAASS